MSNESLSEQLPSGPDPFSSNAEDISLWQIFKVMLLGAARMTVRVTQGGEHGAAAFSNTMELGEVWTETGVITARHAQDEALLKQEGKSIRLKRALEAERREIEMETAKAPKKNTRTRRRSKATAKPAPAAQSEQRIELDDV